jgi:hypothetical protein
MSPTNLSENRVPYWRNDLRGELNAIANYNLHNYQGIEGLSLSAHVIYVREPGYVSKGDYFNMTPKERRTVRDPYRPSPAISRRRFDELVDHEHRFRSISRTAEGDRQISGVDLLCDNSWPFCRECLLPFVTMLNGHARLGCWVCRIEDDDELCECCWLAEHYAGDRKRMIEHVLRCDFGGEVMRASVRIGLRRGWDDDTLVYQNIRDYWQSPGLFELLRLHRVSMSECAGAILSMLETLIAEVRVDERARKQQSDARRDAIWREERMSA